MKSSESPYPEGLPSEIAMGDTHGVQRTLRIAKKPLQGEDWRGAKSLSVEFVLVTKTGGVGASYIPGKAHVVGREHVKPPSTRGTEVKREGTVFRVLPPQFEAFVPNEWQIKVHKVLQETLEGRPLTTSTEHDPCELVDIPSGALLPWSAGPAA